MNRDRILAIEDDAGVCRLLRHTLAREDFNLQIVTTGKGGLDLAREFHPVLILLDLGLPDINGLEVCRRLKSDPETRNLPVIILTGNDKESDIVTGLEIGADDYIIKPVSPRILTARIRTVLRRRMETPATPETSRDLKIGEFTISAQHEIVTLSDIKIELNSAEFNFIHALTQILSTPEINTPLNFSIGQEGMALYAENRIENLLPILKELLSAPQQHPLLYKFTGLALLNTDTTQAGTLLARAAALFEQAENRVAELSVLVHLIQLHLLIDINIEKATELFQRAEQLENPHFEQLSVFSRISAAQALALGYAILCNNFSRAYDYLAIAETLAEDRGLENFQVVNLLIQTYKAYIEADTEKLARTIDETLRLLNHPLINATNRALLKMAQLSYLSLTGDYSYFRSVEKSLREEFGTLFLPSSFPSALLTLLQAQSAQIEGAHDVVLSLKSEETFNSLRKPVLGGMVALSEALTNQPEVAMQSIATYLESDQKIPFFDVQGRLYCIRALLELDQIAEAARMLEQVQFCLQSTNWRAIEIQALALSLLFHRDRPMSADSLDSLQTLLGEMKTTGIRHLLCLSRKDLHYLLCSAVDHDIERLFAAELCRQLLKLSWDRDWKPVPLLEFNTLGGVHLFCEDAQLLSADDFSRSQRDCLAVLIASPKNRVEQEEMQLAFWPDSSPDKARANLDTMLSRLRKTLQAEIKPLVAKKYLKLQKGVITLAHCSFDINTLRFELDRGRRFLSNRNFWRADVAITRGLSLWEGDFIPGSCCTNQTTEVAEQIHQICIKMTLLWGETLTNLGQTTRSIELLDKALSIDRCNEELVAALHRNYMRSNNLAKAGLLLRQYEESLQVEGDSPSEIGRLLTRLRTLIAK